MGFLWRRFICCKSMGLEFGNALSWKHMVQFKNENNYLPDNFGTHWYSPTTRMNFDGAVGQIWKQYIHSADLQFLPPTMNC